MRFLHFLFSKTFLKNFALSILITLLLIFIIFKFLDIYTLHSKSNTVPNFIDLNIENLDQFLIDDEFEFVLIDSVFDNSKESGTIVMQDPLPNSKVKKGRKIYLTIVTELPELVKMPNLVDLSLRQALAELESYGLKAGELKYVPDIAQNAILQQMYNGEIIIPDSLILKGSTIDIVLGRGADNKKTLIPLVIGKTQKEALKILKNAALNIGNEYFLDTDNKKHFCVYKQFPQSFNDTLVNLGQAVDLWYRSDEFFDFDSLIDSFKVKKLVGTSLENDTLFADSLLTDSLFIKFLQTDTIFDEENNSN